MQNSRMLESGSGYNLPAGGMSQSDMSMAVIYHSLQSMYILEQC